MPETAEILTEALGRPIAFGQTPIEQVGQNLEFDVLMALSALPPGYREAAGSNRRQLPLRCQEQKISMNFR